MQAEPAAAEPAAADEVEPATSASPQPPSREPDVSDSPAAGAADEGKLRTLLVEHLPDLKGADCVVAGAHEAREHPLIAVAYLSQCALGYMLVAARATRHG